MGGACSILIVEDEDYIRESLAYYFEDEGYSVTAVESGEKAIAKAERRRFDISIVDIRLSGIDGTRTIQRLKELDPTTHVFVFTGSLEFQITGDLAKLGLTEDFIIYKPINDIAIIGNKIRALGFAPEGT